MTYSLMNKFHNIMVDFLDHVVIRPARHDDLPAINEIRELGRDFLYAQGSMFLDDPNVKAYVAVVDGKPIGWF